MNDAQTNAGRREKGIRLSIVERYYERSLHYFSRERHDLALADLDEAIRRAPRNAELIAARGLVALQAGWDDDAESDFAAALKLDATQWIAHYGRGLHAFQTGRYQEALDHFSRAQQIADDRAEIYYHRAVAFYELNNFQQAILDMETAKSLFAHNKKRQNQADKWLAILRQSQTPDQPDTD